MERKPTKLKYLSSREQSSLLCPSTINNLRKTQHKFLVSVQFYPLNLTFGSVYRTRSYPTPFVYRTMSAQGNQKSVFWAYVLWLFGGLFGVHHFYLRRDRHAFVWWTTLGGFGVGWLGEIFRIPRYVRDANEDPGHMKELVGRMLANKKVCSTYQCFYNIVFIFILIL